jgi:hypothetical protein
MYKAIRKKHETSHQTMKDKIYFSQPTSAEIQYNATEKRLFFHFCAEHLRNRDTKLSATSEYEMGSERSTAMYEHEIGKEFIVASGHKMGCKKSTTASEHKMDRENSTAMREKEVGNEKLATASEKGVCNENSMERKLSMRNRLL